MEFEEHWRVGEERQVLVTQTSAKERHAADLAHQKGDAGQASCIGRDSRDRQALRMMDLADLVIT